MTAHNPQNPSPAALPIPSTSFAPSMPNIEAERRELATATAEKIFKAYPEYGKAPADYVMIVIEVLETFDADIQKALANPATGVVSRCRFLPTIADIVEIAKEFSEKKYRRECLREREIDRRGLIAEPKAYTVPCPFPKLYDAFYDERELLNTTFDMLFDASRSLAMYGKDAARRILTKKEKVQTRGLKVAQELSFDELREKYKREPLGEFPAHLMDATQ